MYILFGFNARDLPLDFVSLFASGHYLVALPSTFPEAAHSVNFSTAISAPRVPPYVRSPAKSTFPAHIRHASRIYDGACGLISTTESPDIVSTSSIAKHRNQPTHLARKSSPDSSSPLRHPRPLPRLRPQCYRSSPSHLPGLDCSENRMPKLLVCAVDGIV